MYGKLGLFPKCLVKSVIFIEFLTTATLIFHRYVLLNKDEKYFWVNKIINFNLLPGLLTKIFCIHHTKKKAVKLILICTSMDIKF